LLIHAEVVAAVLDKFVDLLECAFVEQEFDTFPHSQFAFAVLPRAAVRTSAFFGGCVAAAEFFEAIHQCSEYRWQGFPDRWIAGVTIVLFFRLVRGKIFISQ
jgi:hypothetical protein